MIKYTRPSAPSGYATKAATALAPITERIDPSTGRVKTTSSLESEHFVKTWGAHKSAFNLAQHSKCAYCERLYTGYGDVEHVLPKTEISVLDQPGVEGPDLTMEKPRTASGTVKPGYWWLAYDWKNYCFACNHCNSKWKRTYLTVDPPHSAADVPRRGRMEQILFIHPYDVDPEDHLRVDSAGKIYSLTRKGQGTIDDVGLDRPSLQEARSQAYTDGRNTALLARSSGWNTPDDLVAAMQPQHMFSLARRCGIRDVVGDLIYSELTKLL